MNIDETYSKKDLVDALVVVRNFDPKHRKFYLMEAAKVLKSKTNDEINNTVLKMAKQTYKDLEMGMEDLELKNTSVADNYFSIIDQFQK
jgi:hypothetical protein